MADNGTSLAELTHRMAQWLAQQPEVADIEVLHGPVFSGAQEIIGFRLDGVPISLGMNFTP